MTTENKDRRKKGKVSIASALIFISITIILVVNAFCTLAICCPQIFEKIWPAFSSTDNLTTPLTEAEKVESSLLANGLSIIGMAVAVWASLNIANSINQKDFDKTQKRMSKAEKDIEDIEKTIAPLRDEASGIKNTLRDLFLEELLKLPSIDIPTKYFYRRFSEIIVSDTIVSYLTKIEQTFYQVYMLHDSQKDANSLCLKRANYGISLIEAAQKSLVNLQCDRKEKDLLGLYFNQRKAEFIFYKGYENDGYNYFFTALKEYENLIQDFGCTPMPEHNAERIIPPLTDCEDICVDLKIYFANTIGEAYSKIIENYNKIILNTPSRKDELFRCGEKAIFYCKCATVWKSKTFEKPEVYYRNLGCAYERWDRIFGFGTHSKDIIDSFQKAFELTRFDERPARIKSVYHTLLSYYHRYINTSCNLFPDDLDNYLESNQNFDNNILSKIKEFYDYSEFAKLHLVKNNISHVMNGFALSDIVIAKITNDEAFSDFAISVCMGQIKENLAILTLLSINDDYAKELDRRYKILKEYLSKTEQK